MILGDAEIRRALDAGEIAVDPMAPWALGTNSIDLHLAPSLRVYADVVLRTDRDCPTREVPIPPGVGVCLSPGELYLASTVERTRSGPYLPVIDGTSGAGRLGISVHQTAGIGDVGFEGHWTLELAVVRPVRVFGGEPIAQLRFFEVAGRVLVPYGEKETASYADARESGPVPRGSRMWRKRRWTGAPKCDSCGGTSFRQSDTSDPGSPGASGAGRFGACGREKM